MEEREISIIGKSVLTIPDIVIRTRPFEYNAVDYNGEPVKVRTRTFGVASTIQRNEFNKYICYSLSKSAHIIYSYITFNLGYNTNIIELKHSIVSSETGLSLRSIPNAIEELIKSKVIYKTNKASIYVVNPKCITNCNTEAFEREYNRFNSKYKVSFNSNNELVYKEEVII